MVTPTDATRQPRCHQLTVGELIDGLQSFDRALTVSANREYYVIGIGTVEDGELDLECAWTLPGSQDHD